MVVLAVQGGRHGENHLASEENVLEVARPEVTTLDTILSPATQDVTDRYLERKHTPVGADNHRSKRL